MTMIRRIKSVGMRLSVIWKIRGKTVAGKMGIKRKGFRLKTIVLIWLKNIE